MCIVIKTNSLITRKRLVHTKRGLRKKNIHLNSAVTCCVVGSLGFMGVSGLLSENPNVLANYDSDNNSTTLSTVKVNNKQITDTVVNAKEVKSESSLNYQNDVKTLQMLIKQKEVYIEKSSDFTEFDEETLEEYKTNIEKSINTLELKDIYTEYENKHNDLLEEKKEKELQEKALVEKEREAKDALNTRQSSAASEVVANVVYERSNNIQKDLSGTKASAIYNAAISQIGVYQDCTMLVTNALKSVGVNYHNWPVGYMSLGTVIPASEAKAGDLIYYSNGGTGWAHIAVYAGDGMAIHGGWNGNQTVMQSAYVGSGPVFIRVA